MSLLIRADDQNMDEEYIEDAQVIVTGNQYSGSAHGHWDHQHYPLTDERPAPREELAVSPLFVDPLSLELPRSVERPEDGLDGLVDQVRAQLGKHLGVIAPGLHVEDCDGAEWRLLLHEDEIARGAATGAGVDEIFGKVDEALHEHASELLTFDATVDLLRWARRESPALVSQLVPNMYDIPMIRGALRQLLKDGISIRPISLVFDAMASISRQSGPAELAEAIRPSLWRSIRNRARQADGSIKVVRVVPGAVRGICAGAQHTSAGQVLRVSDEMSRELQRSFEQAQAENPGLTPFVLACPSRGRRWVSAFFTRKYPGTLVVGDEELANISDVEEVGLLGEGIVPVPRTSPDGRQPVEAYIETSYEQGWGSGSSYLLGS